MKSFEITLKGVTTLLMHSTQGLNPLDPRVKELKALTSKRKKTDDDIIEIAHRDYTLSSYYSDDVIDATGNVAKKGIGFYIPSEMIEASIREGAKVTKNGKKVAVAVNVDGLENKLLFEGPIKSNDPKVPTIEDLWSDEQGRWTDARIVVVQRARVMRYRPRFNQWKVTFTVRLDETLMDYEEFKDALIKAGELKGLGDSRPKYGRFEVESLKEIPFAIR